MENKASEFSPTLGGKRILVTGGAGYIGSHVCVQLLEAGAEVIVLDNLSNSSEESLKRVAQITGKPVTRFYEINICDEAAVQKVFQEEAKFDACIHFAGLKAVGESVSIPLKYYRNNLICTLNLLDQLKANGCLNFVFSSSATVYGESQNMPLVETEPLSVTNPYGQTKLMIEEILRDVAKADPQWKVAILRYFNPIGAHESGLIGEDPRDIPNNLMPYISQVAIGKRTHLNVFGDDYDTIDGTGVRDYIHVVDLARGHLAALSNAIFGEMKTNCEPYNLGSGIGTSVLQLLAAMEKACGHKLEHKITPRRPGDVATCYADSSKAAAELNWRTQISIDQAAADSWRWQSQNPDGYACQQQDSDDK